MLNQGQNLTHSRRNFMRLSKVHLSNSVRLFMENFSVTPHFPCNLMPGSLDKFYFSSSILHTFCGFPREIDWSIDLHDATPSSVIQVGCWFHTQPHNQHFFVLQIILSLSVSSTFILKSSPSFSFKVIMDQTRIFLALGTTHWQVRNLSLPSTLRSVAEPRNSLVLAAVGCRCRLLMHAEGQRHYKDSLLFLA